VTQITGPEKLVRRQAREEVRQQVIRDADFPATPDGAMYRAAMRRVVYVLDQLDRNDGFEVPQRQWKNDALVELLAASPDLARRDRQVREREERANRPKVSLLDRLREKL
jgi:hypothetical protein